MKVICKNCGKLADEDDAIKMSCADFAYWQMTKDLPFVGVPDWHYRTYTQICQGCYVLNKDK